MRCVFGLVCKWMFNSILPIYDYVTRHDSIRIVHDNLGIVQFAPNLSVHTVVAWRWTCQLLTVPLELVLFPWAYVTEEHCSDTVGTLRVIVAFGRVGSKVESIAKSLEVNIVPDEFSVETGARNSTDAAVPIIAEYLSGRDIASYCGAMEVFFDCPILKFSFVGPPLLFQGWVCDHKHAINGRTRPLFQFPFSCELCSYLGKFIFIGRSDHS